MKNVGHLAFGPLTSARNYLNSPGAATGKDIISPWEKFANRNIPKTSVTPTAPKANWEPYDNDGIKT